MTKVEIKSAPHRRIAIADILPNPHRDLDLNPTSPIRVGQLLESFERTGFWDNVVAREHPTREGKYQLAYGHNRLAALKDKSIVVDIITIPIVKLTDWEMYCAMVDENEMQGTITPAIAMENIGVGCNLIEKALKKIGKSGTWEEFIETVGSRVSADTREFTDHGFNRVRDNFFDGEGLGNKFLSEFLPCGKMRANTISTVVNERYAADREKAKRAEAARKAAQAKDKERRAKEEKDAEERRRLEEEAAIEREEARKLEEAADKIGKGHISRDILLMFDATRTMSDFAGAIRKFGIEKKHHLAAAKHVINANVKEERIGQELSVWWDQVSGASEKRKKDAKAQADREAFLKKTQGRDFISILLRLKKSLADEEENWKIAIAAVHLAEPKERKVIEEIAKSAKLINTLVERSRETLGEFTEISTTKMLSHR